MKYIAGALALAVILQLAGVPVVSEAWHGLGIAVGKVSNSPHNPISGWKW